MALYHFSHKIISRSTKNTVAALAYRSGTRLVDKRLDRTFDYRNKNVLHSEILLPPEPPAWAKTLQHICRKNREEGLQKLSLLVEASENRCDAQIYRELEFSLPHELDESQNIILANSFIYDQCCLLGILAINSFHFDVDKKYHCHTLLLMRELTINGLSKIKNRAWNDKSYHHLWREHYSVYQNYYLSYFGRTKTIDHRSYQERGISIKAQPKMGKDFSEIERRGSLLRKRILAQTVKLENFFQILKTPSLALKLLQVNGDVLSFKNILKIISNYTDDQALIKSLRPQFKFFISFLRRKKISHTIKDRINYSLKVDKDLPSFLSVSSKSEKEQEMPLEDSSETYFLKSIKDSLEDRPIKGLSEALGRSETFSQKYELNQAPFFHEGSPVFFLILIIGIISFCIHFSNKKS